MLQSRVRTPSARRVKAAPALPRASRPAASTRTLGRTIRPFVMLIVIALSATGISARLVFWQVMQHGHLSALETAERSYGQQPPLRGQIFDAHGNPLAIDVSTHLLYVSPREIKDPKRTAEALAPIIHMSAATLESLFATDVIYVPIVHNLNDRVAARIQALGLPGVGLDPEIQRQYPEGTVASQVIGFVRTDGTAQYGVEQTYDRVLSGTAGLRSVLTDTAGNNIQISNSPNIPSQNGADLHLSIDGVVQGLVEDELNKAVKQHSADGGTVIVMNPKTGYILGMASTPSFNPNSYSTVTDPSHFLNPAIDWTYEPGSTFKIITMAAGLDSGAITPQSALDDTGRFVVGNTVLHNWNDGGFGWENMTQVLQHSANVGASWVAQRLGTARFYEYLHRFRFGQPTGVDLGGEEGGILPLPGQKSWSIVNLYTNSFGQGISVTPLQLIRAVAAVANDGIEMKPQLVREIVYKGHTIVHRPVRVGRVISAATAHTLTDMLVHSAIGGEASLGLVKGYDIAAKTGTANVAGPNGQYIANDTIASIVGYAPAANPKVVALIIIRHPRDTPWGSMAAAPVLHDLLQELFMYYHIPPNPHALNR